MSNFFIEKGNGKSNFILNKNLVKSVEISVEDEDEKCKKTIVNYYFMDGSYISSTASWESESKERLKEKLTKEIMKKLNKE